VQFPFRAAARRRQGQRSDRGYFVVSAKGLDRAHQSWCISMTHLNFDRSLVAIGKLKMNRNNFV
jgi:hypothetical protein